MLKQTLAVCRALMFLGVLSLVVGERGVLANNLLHEGLPFVVSTFKNTCLDNLDPLFCKYWNSLSYRESPNFLKPEQINELTSENQTLENETPDENLQEIYPESSLINPENHLYKRFIVYRKKNPTARGYKRGPGFRSWGGKRDPIISGQNLDKKSKFVLWGSEQEGEFLSNDLINSDSELRNAPDKRPKFQNWGGKKSTNDLLEEYGNEKEKRSIWKDKYYLIEPFKKHVPKRPQFQSWGGKRNTYPWPGFFEFLHSQSKFLLNGGKKRKFSSWGGKRYDDYEDQHWMKSLGDTPKRHVFQNWGGKRTTSDLNVPGAMEMKESDSNEKAIQRDKRKMNANWEDEGDHSNLDSLGNEIRDGKNRR